MTGFLTCIIHKYCRTLDLFLCPDRIPRRSVVCMATVPSPESVANKNPASLRAFTHRQAQSSRRFMNNAG